MFDREGESETMSSTETPNGQNEDNEHHRVMLLLSSSDSNDQDDDEDENQTTSVVNRPRSAGQCLHLDDESHLGCVIANIANGNTTMRWRIALSVAMVAHRRTGHSRSIVEMERFLRWQPCFAETTGLSTSTAAIRTVLNVGLQFFHFRFETLRARTPRPHLTNPSYSYMFF
jgi:hypothetical protein